MTIKLIILTVVTLLIAIVALIQPQQERDWPLGALAAGILALGYYLAVQQVLQRELESPLRLIERLTQWILR